MSAVPSPNIHLKVLWWAIADGKIQSQDTLVKPCGLLFFIVLLQKLGLLLVLGFEGLLPSFPAHDTFRPLTRTLHLSRLHHSPLPWVSSWLWVHLPTSEKSLYFFSFFPPLLHFSLFPAVWLSYVSRAFPILSIYFGSRGSWGVSRGSLPGRGSGPGSSPID